MADKTSDAIASALREGLADPYFDSVRNVAAVALVPVVERLLAEQEKCIDAAVEQRDIIVAKCDEAERRLREIRDFVEAEHNDTQDVVAAMRLSRVLALLDTGAVQGVGAGARRIQTLVGSRDGVLRRGV